MRLVFIYEFDHLLGGMSHSFMDMIKTISKLYDVLILSPKSENVAEFANSLNVAFVQTGSDLNWQTISFSRPFRSSLTAFRIQSFIKSQLRSGDIIVVNGLLPEFLCGIFGRLSAWPRVFFVRGEVGASRLWRMLSFKGLAKLVCVSRFSADSFLKVFPRMESYVELLNNPIELPPVRNNIEGRGGKGFIIGCVGFFHPNKNQAMLLRIIGDLRERGVDAKVHFYGKAASTVDLQYLSFLESEISRLNISEYVRFCGYQERDEIFLNINILVSTSKVEGFGKTLIEGMAYGVPVIAFAPAGGPKDIIENGVNGVLIDEFSDDKLLESIFVIANERDFRDKIIRGGYRSVVDKFSLGVWRDRFVAILEAIGSR